mmetsp:Transcript_87631/g.271338  ORF Transcript_87631/g.271338 Transcript_87631/m.271338 type:complete len:200 (-) Transcript_87631:2174-2773(-)
MARGTAMAPASPPARRPVSTVRMVAARGTCRRMVQARPLATSRARPPARRMAQGADHGTCQGRAPLRRPARLPASLAQATAPGTCLRRPLPTPPAHPRKCRWRLPPRPPARAAAGRQAATCPGKRRSARPAAHRASHPRGVWRSTRPRRRICRRSSCSRRSTAPTRCCGARQTLTRLPVSRSQTSTPCARPAEAQEPGT